MIEDPLTDEQVRVLGALMEKSVTTPENYPLSLNALTAACNQKTSREPVVEYEEDEVLRVIDELRDHGLVLRVDVAGSRVPKFRHRVPEAWEIDRPAFALLTVLMLRGPQTPGQLRQRTERMFVFRDTQAVVDTLQAMSEREEEPHELVTPMPILPGSREQRFRHTIGQTTLSRDPEPEAAPEAMTAVPRALIPEAAPAEETEFLRGEVEDLKASVSMLREELHALRDAFDTFRQQFD